MSAPHVARYRIVDQQGIERPTIVGCTCGFDCTTENPDDEIINHISLSQWARDVGAPRPTTMPSLPVRLGVIHDELLRAAIAWAHADRAADVAADKIDELQTERANLNATANETPEQTKGFDGRERHASIAFDIAGAAEQKADEALRAIAKRLLAELGI